MGVHRTSRIEPQPESEWDAEVRALLRRRGQDVDRDRDIRATLVRHRALSDTWGPFAESLMRKGTLIPADRELMILRVAWRCGCSHEWGRHAEIGRSSGLTGEHLRELVTAQPGSPLSDWQRLLVRSVDEFVIDHTLSGDVWALLSERLDELQLIELSFLIGHYAMVAGAPRFPVLSDDVA